MRYFLNQRLSWESTDVNYKMTAEFHLAFVSCSLCRACCHNLLGHLSETEASLMLLETAVLSPI